MSPYASKGRLPRDPDPGSRDWQILAHNLQVERDRLARLDVLAERLPQAITDARLEIRDLELRLGLPPSYPPPTPKDPTP